MNHSTVLKDRSNRPAFVLLGILAILLILSGCGGNQAANNPETVDEPAVYATVIERIYTVDDTFGGELQPTQVYLLSQTDDMIGGPDIEQMPGTAVGAATQQAIVAELAHLPAQWTWVGDRAEVPLTAEGEVEGGGVIITLGNIHPQADGTLMVPGSIYIANLAAGGQTFILTPTDAGWTVTDTTGEWIS